MRTLSSDQWTCAEGARRHSLIVASLVVLTLLATPAAAGKDAQDIDPSAAGSGLAELSLEALMNIKVTTASRKEKELSKTAGAVYVITQEDIRRSGVTSVPEALRMAPGLQVARIDGSSWAITSRGFNSLYSNMLQVLVDGRSVYSPLFSGMDWDTLDMVLEDIDRIEVIRGPGAVMWGSNSVNGVINIITKHSKETQGVLVSGLAGTAEGQSGSVRQGGSFGETGTYRIFGKTFRRRPAAQTEGRPEQGDWKSLRGGFRVDWSGTKKDDFTLMGDVFDASSEHVRDTPIFRPPFTDTRVDREQSQGAYLLGRWVHRASERSDWGVQLSYDRLHRDNLHLGEKRNVVEVTFQHRYQLNSKHELLWGAGNRYASDRVRGSEVSWFTPESESAHRLNAFFQDEIELAPDRLSLMVGIGLERNPYTGFEPQPDVRLLWTPHARHSVWASSSRAMRTPSRVDRGLGAQGGIFPMGQTLGLVRIFGNPEAESERLWANEAGYRFQWNKRLTFDFAGFYNDYANLEIPVQDTPYFEFGPGGSYMVLPLRFANGPTAETRGVEAWAHWQAREWWRLSGSYTWLDMDYHFDASVTDTLNKGHSGTYPSHQTQLRSSLNLPRHLEWDVAAYTVGPLPGLDVPGYLRLDSRVGWRIRPELELSLVLQDLLDSHHPEYGLMRDGLVWPGEMRRNIYGKVVWLF